MALLGVGAEQLADDFARDQPTDVDTWLRLHGFTPVNPKVDKVLADLHTESKWLGVASGTAKATGKPLDLRGWKPGDTARAKDFLANPNVRSQTSAQSLNDTQVRRLSNLLNRHRGATAAVVATAVGAYFAGANDWADTVASTESRGSVTDGTMEAFLDNNVQMVQWVTSSGDPCAFCIDQEAMGPQDISEFDTEPPAHPNCMCDLVPASEGLAVEPTLTKAARTAVEKALEKLDEIPMIDEKHIAVPWNTAPRPKLDPEVWAGSKIQDFHIASLTASQRMLRKKKVRKFIESQGAPRNGDRALPNVYAKDGNNVIVDGHHRLAALWLLGADVANCWFLEE